MSNFEFDETKTYPISFTITGFFGYTIGHLGVGVTFGLLIGKAIFGG